MFVDSHFHFFTESEEDKYETIGKDNRQIVEDALEAGVSKMLAVSASYDDWKTIRHFIEGFKGKVFGSFGFHPHEASEIDFDSEEMQLENLIKHFEMLGDGFVAIGECGLDYAFPDTDKEAQKRLFDLQVEMALRLKKPLIIHTREADEDVYPILKKFAEKGGMAVIHCWTGDEEYVKKYLDLGFYVSCSGITTFKKSLDLQNQFKNIVPMDRLLVETDAPYLAPVPVRGKVNVPFNVKYVAEFVANMKEIGQEEFNKQVENNFNNLFLK
ncbi:MAG: TatD family hydrolase [Alphaproteobacteria bacterium]|jgi:TatD DNase family protein|nr:TatD family hydrolase [Alphaproteobacteria bacterium]